MKGSFTRFALLFGLAAGSVGAAHADSSPAGLWRVSTFTSPGGAAATVQTVCLKSDHTWYSTSQPNWSGGWFQNEKEVHWYGGIPVSHIGNVASMAMGNLDSATTMTGNYAEWTAPGTAPFTFDRHFTYSMVFLQADCPPAKQ
ncbi:hypothetical protein [Pseudomonas vranovensis]|uniref:Uncharacterized protein n=1 Tax=Pseudomonas vranovensis TaxID=321661 RepID=A0A423CZR4_9PSED|nr:hypothetical protein [Pseudomonas vranovensis]ROL64833.1 hypothetical protein BHU25_23455 [Pseudomonas vranovensis]